MLECLQPPDLSPGLARELKKQVTILEAQIAELIARRPSDDVT